MGGGGLQGSRLAGSEIEPNFGRKPAANLTATFATLDSCPRLGSVTPVTVPGAGQTTFGENGNPVRAKRIMKRGT